MVKIIWSVVALLFVARCACYGAAAAISPDANNARSLGVDTRLQKQQQQKHANQITGLNMINARVPRLSPWFEFISPSYGSILSSTSTQVRFVLGGFTVPHGGTLVFSTHKAGAQDMEIKHGLNCSRKFDPDGQCSGILRLDGLEPGTHCISVKLKSEITGNISPWGSGPSAFIHLIFDHVPNGWAAPLALLSRSKVPSSTERPPIIPLLLQNTTRWVFSLNKTREVDIGIEETTREILQLEFNRIIANDKLKAPFRIEKEDMSRGSVSAKREYIKDEIETTSQTANHLNEMYTKRSKERGVRNPIHLVFVGTLGMDGQKSIWRAQFQRLDRQLFAPRFVVYETGITNSDDRPFRKELEQDSVPLMLVPIPPIHSGGIVNSADIAVNVLAQSVSTATAIVRRVVDKNIVGFEIFEPFSTQDTFKSRLSHTRQHNTQKQRHKAEYYRLSPRNQCSALSFTFLILLTPWWGSAFVLSICGALDGAHVVVSGNSQLPTDQLLMRCAAFVGAASVMDLPNLSPWPDIAPDVVVAPSHFAATHHSVYGAMAKRTMVIHPGVDTQLFDPERNWLQRGNGECANLEGNCKISVGSHVITNRKIRTEPLGLGSNSHMIKPEILQNASGGMYIRDDFNKEFPKRIISEGSHNCEESRMFPESSSQGKPDNVFVVGFVGRLSPEKSVGLFVRMGAALQDQWNKFPNRNFSEHQTSDMQELKKMDEFEYQHTHTSYRSTEEKEKEGAEEEQQHQHQQHHHHHQKQKQKHCFNSENDTNTDGPSNINPRLPRLILRIIGDGSMRGPITHLAWRLGVKLEFYGAIYDRNILATEMGKLDVVVNPSLRSDSETFCIANVEAMSMCKPVVSFGAGGVGDYLKHNENGVVVRINESSSSDREKKSYIGSAAGSLAGAVMDLARDKRKRERLGIRARHDAVEGFD